MRLVVFARLSCLVGLFGLGIVLLLLGAMWFAQSGNWMGTAALLIVASTNIGLAMFGKRNVSLVAATVISAFWTVSAAVAFSKESFELEAWVLLLSSVFQVSGTVFGLLVLPTSSPLLDPEGFLPPQYFSQPQQPPTSYGALSHFVDPLSSVPHTSATGNGHRTSSISSSISGGNSPNLSSMKRVPSPFGSHKFPSTLPSSQQQVSAATLPPQDQV
ncbi:hypothetical protein BASA81_002036 [Batrachochytrium salamandrivorans]|nr:hypothetical protein BASA81_002036 [Batrachochytrium salamandrivorans]